MTCVSISLYAVTLALTCCDICLSFSRPMAMGWRSGVEPKPVIPGTPGVVMDETDFAFPTRIMEKVTATVLGVFINMFLVAMWFLNAATLKLNQLRLFVAIEKPKHRRIGEGFIGQLFHRSMKNHDASGSVKEQIKNLNTSHR